MIEKIPTLSISNGEEWRTTKVPLSGWVGSVGDLKKLLNDFRSLRDTVVHDESLKIEHICVSNLRDNELSKANFLETLRSKIESFEQTVKFTLVTIDEADQITELQDEDIDREIDSLVFERIKAFKVKISYDWSHETGDGTSIEVIFTDKSSRIEVFSNYDNSEYVTFIHKKCEITEPKHKWMRSIGLLIALQLALLILVLQTIEKFTTLSLTIMLTIIFAIISLSICSVAVKRFARYINPRVEIYRIGSSSKLNRSLIFWIPVTIDLLGVIAAILALKATNWN